MSFVAKIQPYTVISLSLTAARTDGAQGTLTLPDFVEGGSKTLQDWVANTITAISLDGGSLSVKLGSADAESITLSDGLKVEGVPFRELYWTNAAQAGLTAEIYLAWVD